MEKLETNIRAREFINVKKALVDEPEGNSKKDLAKEALYNLMKNAAENAKPEITVSLTDKELNKITEIISQESKAIKEEILIEIKKEFENQNSKELLNKNDYNKEIKFNEASHSKNYDFYRLAIAAAGFIFIFVLIHLIFFSVDVQKNENPYNVHVEQDL